MNDQDIIDATRSSGVALAESSRAAMRSVLEAAVRGDDIAPVVPISGAHRRSPSVRWWAAALVAAAAAVAIVNLTTTDDTKHITPATVPDTVDGTDNSAIPTTAAPVVAPAVTLSELTGHRWIVVSTTSADGEQPWPSAVLPYVEFGTGATVLSGNDGCNDYTSSGSLEEGSLRIPSGGSTAVLCADVTEDGALHDGDHLTLSADGTTLDVSSAGQGPRLTLVQAEALPKTGDLDGRYVVKAGSLLNVDLVQPPQMVFVGTCVAAWRYENGQLVPDAAALQLLLQSVCTDNLTLGRDEQQLLSALTDGSIISVVQRTGSDSIILLGHGSPIRLTPADKPLSTDGITIDRGAVLGLITAGQLGADATLAALQPRLGPVDHDTGWYTTPVVTYPDGTGDCLGGIDFRVLWWGDLSLAFWRISEGEQLWAWSVGDKQASASGDRREPYTPTNPAASGMATDEGIHVGSSQDEMLAAYGDRFVLRDPALKDGTQLYVSNDPSGFLGHRSIGVSITVRDGVVTGIGSARQFC